MIESTTPLSHIEVKDGELLPAWTNPVHAAQSCFRQVLSALSEPGTVHTIAFDMPVPAATHPASMALCLCLLDYDTPLYLSPKVDNAALQAYLRFHCGCPLTQQREKAAFALLNVADEEFCLSTFAQASLDFPERSCTLFVQVPSLHSLDVADHRWLQGPGIAEQHSLRVQGLPTNFDAMWRANQESFPLGVDIVFCCGNQIVGLPRTTKLEREPLCTSQ
ncbi:MAG: phosphonate C-P lyase system protein PhnH [Burkholderiaceae bacterium]|nr:phosphonate C-P lyase system protein PhnH [Burkholderiaceae bacterium]